MLELCHFVINIGSSRGYINRAMYTQVGTIGNPVTINIDKEIADYACQLPGMSDWQTTQHTHDEDNEYNAQQTITIENVTDSYNGPFLCVPTLANNTHIDILAKSTNFIPAHIVVASKGCFSLCTVCLFFQISLLYL